MPSSRDHLRRRGAGNGSATDGFKRVRGRALDFLTVVTTHLSFWMPVLLFCSGRTEVNAQDLLPPDSDIVTVIDHYIQQKLASTSIPVVAPADDMSLLRRTTLDLAGRVPTATDRKWFMSLPEAERRRQLVDRLMHLPDYDFHLRNWLDETLLPNQRFDDDFRAYLLTAVRSRRNWDTIFREIIRANAVDGPDKGASKFVMSRVRELDDLTNDTAVLFFGVNISCAKCHDHPLVPDWKQDHFYGMQAFFSRTYPTRKTNTISERPFGEVRFATVSGEDKKAAFMFLTGEIVGDRTPQLGEEERKQLEERVRKLENDDTEAELLVPEFRPREELVDLALRDSKDRFFARNIINRTWERLLGTGLVDPPDQLHSGNPSSHPQLFDWLTNDLVTHGYDLQRLIRAIVLSEAYARSGEWTTGSEPPPAPAFAVAQTRALTPRQLAASLHIVAQDPEQWPTMDNPDEWTKRRTDLENQANGWVRDFEQPSENFQIGVDEALFFNNNDRVQNELLRDSDDQLLGRLAKADDQQSEIEQLWLTVLNRPPEPEELNAANSWLERTPENRSASRRQLLWALLAGPEFRFNH